MDMERGEVRTMFNQDSATLEEVDGDGSAILAADRTSANYTKTGDLISLPYTEASVIQNPYATKTENFQGDGHKLGGNKYVNRLLGIDHKEGKRLAKLAKKQAKAAKKYHHLMVAAAA